MNLSSRQKREDTHWHHHEQKRYAQLSFAQSVQALTATIEEMGNPFIESSGDLLVLDSRNIIDTAVVDTLCHIEKLGQDQYEAYVEERLINQTKPITDPIKRNSLPLFSSPPVREVKQTVETDVLKE